MPRSSSDNELENKMEKHLKNREFERFIAYFYQYNSYVGKNKGSSKIKKLVEYKSLALLYFLATSQHSKYHSLVQSCTNPESYEHVLNCYDSISICDMSHLQSMYESSSGHFKVFLEMICKNQNKPILVEDNKTEVVSMGVYEKNIKDNLYVLEDLMKQ